MEAHEKLTIFILSQVSTLTRKKKSLNSWMENLFVSETAQNFHAHTTGSYGMILSDVNIAV
jgi:hypothetical protein